MTVTDPDGIEGAHDQPPRIPMAGWALVVGWLAIPAVQYFGAAIRTQIALAFAEGKRTSTDLVGIERLALVDLTPLYVLLVMATAVVAYVRWRASSRAGASR